LSAAETRHQPEQKRKKNTIAANEPY